MENIDFDVIIIGAGIYGASMAYSLSKYGLKIVLIEKETPGGAGSSKYSGGIVRVYDEDESLIANNLAGLYEFANWNSIGYPGNSPFFQTGLLYLLKNESVIRAKEIIERSCSDETELIESEQLIDNFPFLKNHTGDYLLYEKNSGYADVRLTIKNLIEGYKSNGGLLLENCNVESAINNDGNWSVKTTFANLHSSVVVFTVGSSIRNFFPDLEVFTKSVPLTLISERETPFILPVIDEINNVFTRPLNGEFFFCGTPGKHINEFPEQLPKYSEIELEDVLSKISKVNGKNYSANVINGFNGHDSYTNDCRPIYQFHKIFKGAYYLSGMSGRGFKSSLAVSKKATKEIIEYLQISNELK